MLRFSKLKFIIISVIALVVIACVMNFLKRKSIHNVLLISIDTCRADHLGCYGFKKQTTPNIDRLAERGILFRNASTPIGLTLPAHSSMFTGTYPLYHGIHDNLNSKLDESNLTIAEILKENGFLTGAVISAYVLDSQFGVAQGFDYYNEDFEDFSDNKRQTERRAKEAGRITCEFIEKNRDI